MSEAARPPRRPIGPLPAALALAALLAAGALTLGGNWDRWFGEGGDGKAPSAAAGPEAKAAAPADPFAKFAAGKAGDPAAAVRLVDAYVDGARADNDAYIDALSAAGYLRAIGGEALAGGEIAQAVDRVRRGRALAAEHRAKSLQRVDRLEAALKALPAPSPEAAALREEMAVETAELRDARIAAWDALNEASGEVEALARILTRAQGRWTVDLQSREVLFEDEADDAEYSRHEDRGREHRSRFEEASARAGRAAEALRTLAARWGS